MKQYLVHCSSSLADSNSEAVKFVITAENFDSATHLAKEKASVHDSNLKIDGILELMTFVEDEVALGESKPSRSFAEDVRGRTSKVQPMDGLT